MIKKYVIGLLFCIVLAGRGMAEDRLDLGTTVFGDKEAPKALYIVPWKTLGIGDAAPEGGDVLLDEQLRPIDTERFRWELELYRIGRAARSGDSE